MRGRFFVLAAALGALTAPVAAQVGAPAMGALSPAPVLRVWPLGDSITLGASSPSWVPGGYRAPLDEILASAKVAHQFVGTTVLNSSPTLDTDGEAWHDGHGGYRIDQVLSDLDGVAHADSDGAGHWLTGGRLRHGLMPDVVLVHLGTNDMMQTWDTRRFPTSNGRVDLANTRQRAEFVADMTGRLRTLVARVHALRPAARIVVATIIPIAIPKYASAVAQYAVSVRRLVSQLQAQRLPVQLADAYAAFMVSAGSSVAPGLLCYDNIHPTAAGYAVIARSFAADLGAG